MEHRAASPRFVACLAVIAALVFGGELGMAYLGTQGDVWDSHKDTALAIGGSLATLLGLGARALWSRRGRVA